MTATMTPEELGLETLYTVSEVAQILRVDRITIIRWVERGAMEAVTLPGKGLKNFYRIKQSTLDKLLKAGAR